MNFKTETRQIGDFHYTVTALPAKAGCRVAARMAKALAPAAKSLPEEGFELDPAQIVKLLEPIFANPDLGDLVDFLCVTFAERTLLDWDDATGHKQVPLSRVFDQHFSDRYDDLIAWLAFALQTSMSSFFRSARGLAVQAAAGVSLKSPNSAAKTGPAGG
jgi:hypothetical protein